ncbi:hypothetical protein D3C76_1145550 [compost metagenome]
MVDIQQRTLSTFEHDEIATLARLVQQIGHIHNHTGQDIRYRHDIIQHFLVVNGVSFVEVHQLEVVIFHHFFQFFSEGGFVEQVANAQTATSNFIFVSRADATAGGADSFCTACFFARYVQCNVIVEDQRAGFGEQQTLTNRDTTVFQAFHLFHQRSRRQHNTVTDDAGHIVTKNT